MAVFTEVSDEALAAFLGAYDIGAAVALKGISEGTENTTYLLHTERGPFILTLFEKRVAAKDLPYFLALMEHLAARGVPCPTPIKDRGGTDLRALCGRPASIVTFLPGLWPRRATPPQCRAFGAAMAGLHRAAADFPASRRNDLALRDLRPILASRRDRADELRPGLAAELDDALSGIEARWPDALPAGTIHADLFPDNVFFRGETVTGIIDFYFACTDFLAYDIAVALNAWCFEISGEFNVTKAAQMLAGYQTVRRLEPEERAALPVLAAGAALRFAATRLVDWFDRPDGALVRPKDPLEFVHRLAFHRGAAGPEAYGI